MLNVAPFIYLALPKTCPISTPRRVARSTGNVFLQNLPPLRIGAFLAGVPNGDLLLSGHFRSFTS